MKYLLVTIVLGIALANFASISVFAETGIVNPQISNSVELIELEGIEIVNQEHGIKSEEIGHTYTVQPESENRNIVGIIRNVIISFFALIGFIVSVNAAIHKFFGKDLLESSRKSISNYFKYCHRRAYYKVVNSRKFIDWQYKVLQTLYC